jgi:L1 cell adhesion molecule like protein
VENWLSSNPNAETAEYEGKQKDLERMANPIMAKMYQGSAGANCGAQFNQSQPQGHAPNVDEVD